MKILIGFLFMALLGASCVEVEMSECNRIADSLRDGAVKREIREWVNSNIKNIYVGSGYLRSRGAAGIGSYVIDIEFDWDILGINPDDGQIKCIVDKNDNVIAIAILGNYCGVIYIIEHEEGIVKFGVKDSEVTSYGENIMLYRPDR